MRRLFLGLAIASIAALSPCWALADDQQIAQQIVQQLRQHKAEGRLNGFGIDLEVESGIVWLKGHVTTAEQQQIVVDAPRDGVGQGVNDLQVESTDLRTSKAAPPAKSRDSAKRPKTGQAPNINRKRSACVAKCCASNRKLRGSVQRALGETGRADKSAPLSPRPVVAQTARSDADRFRDSSLQRPSDEELAET